MVLKEIADFKKMVANMQTQGKTEQQIKNAISARLSERKKKVNPNGDLDNV